MAVQFATWTGATHCADGPTPGARAFAKVAMEQFHGLRNGGIFVCRNVVGGSNFSCHAEGRAWDPMCSIRDGNVLVAALLAAGPQRLGIQAIIHNRVIYSKRSPGGRPYGGPGVNPHLDHVHIEFTRAAGAKLTPATVRAVLAGHAPAPDRDLGPGDRGPAVRVLQTALHVTADGVFGPDTERAVNRVKAAHGLPEDGIAGARVRAVLGL